MQLFLLTVIMIIIKADAPSCRLARILTAAQGHSGDRITAYPIAQVGTRLDDETLRISVALWVGLNVCLAHQCRCGATVQSERLHTLSYRFSVGRFSRHSAINNIIKRSIDTAGFHSILVPVGLDGGDGEKTRCSDVFSLQRWQGIGLGYHLY